MLGAFRAPEDGERDRGPDALLLVLGLALAGFLVLTAFWVFDELGRSRGLRETLIESFEARTQINRLYIQTLEAESSQRGFVIAGEDRYLSDYRASEREVLERLDRLQALFATDEGQGERARLLRRLIEQKFAEMERVIDQRRAGDAVGARAVIAQGRGRDLMDRVRTVVEQLRDHEAAAIADRVEEDRVRAERTENMIVFLFISLLIGALVTVLMIRNYAGARRRLIEQGRAEAARERAVFDAAMDGILMLDRRGVIERANPAAERVFAAEPAALVGRPVSDLVEAEALDALKDPAAVEHGVRGTGAGRRADGAGFPLEVSLARTRFAGGEGVLAFIRDISEQREVERLKDEFVSTVSHELRTPLTSIAGSLGLVAGGAAGAIPDKVARLVSIAQSNSQRLVRLINDVLDLEKLESGKMPFAFGQVDLREVAIRSIEDLRGYADQLGVALALAPGQAVWVRGDFDRLVQVATNLISNAAKFSPKGGAVDVGVERRGAAARLSVADRGPGVPEAFRDRIFSRFAQADSSDTRGKSGTGLGLYIAKGITERHGGRLWFEARAGGGTVFNLDVPPYEQPALTGARDRVLLVEDEPAAAALLQSVLEQDGLKVDHAQTLAEARQALERPDRYGAMVLDVRLPDGDGLDLLRELRTRADTRGMPVVIVSGEAASGRAPEVRALEVVDWVEKPVDPDRLTELIRSAGAGSDVSLILHVDDDPDIREVVATALTGYGEVLSVDGLTAARQALAERRPDLVVLDLELRDGSGLDLLPDLVDERGRQIPVLVFSAQDAGDLGPAISAVMVKSRTSLPGLVSAVRDLVVKGGA